LIKDEQHGFRLVPAGIGRSGRRRLAGRWAAGSGPLREAAERGELAGAVACLAGSSGLRLRGDDPVAPLAREVARALTLAGFAVHHCVQADPLHRVGGVCLLPVAAWGSAGGQAGVAVSWTTHSLLLLDWDRWGEHRGVQEAMKPALAGVLGAAGFCV
jgi:hypothetical protein